MEDRRKIKECIENGFPVSFLKFGDGEYAAANFWGGTNCDRDYYTHKLGVSLRESFIYQINNNNNCNMGLWHHSDKKVFWDSLVENKSINWVDYHIFIFDNNDLEDNNKFIDKIDLYKKIKDSKRKKIYICNELMVRSKILLDIDYLIHTPLQNWFDNNLEDIINKVIELIGEEDGKHMILTSCGMGAKVLLTELYKRYPKGIYLDIGSALDLICTKKDSRGWNYNYDTLYEKFKENDFIPNDWDNQCYDHIYPKAKICLGTHL